MKLLTVREACERLRISRATLYKLARQGKLVLSKVGGRSVISEEALEQLVTPSPLNAPRHEAEFYLLGLLRQGVIAADSRQALITPRFVPFQPIKAQGTPASEIIIAERGMH